MAVQVIQLVEEIMGNWHIKGPIINCLIFMDFFKHPKFNVSGIYIL